MEIHEGLPVRFDDIEVPTYFGVTALRPWGCVLRSIGPSLLASGVGTVSRGAAADLGTALHRVLDAADRIVLRDKGMEEVLDELFEAEFSPSMLSWIRRELGEELIADRVCSTRSKIERSWRLREPHPTRRPKSRTNGKRSMHSRMAGTRREVPFEDSELRLRGRIDQLVVSLPDELRVVDDKTGRVRDKEGEVREEIRTQMHAYAMVVERVFGRRPTMEVRGDVRVELTFEPELSETIVGWLEHLNSLLPRDGVLDASSLTSPGSECVRCPVRHICPVYEAEATSWSHSRPEAFTPDLDMFGTVTRVLRNGSNVAADVESSSGRRRVLGWSVEQASRLEVGRTKVEIYGAWPQKDWNPGDSAPTSLYLHHPHAGAIEWTVARVYLSEK